MKAWAVVEAGAPLRCIEIEQPQPTGTEVLVQVSHCGVCHSDVHFWEGFLDFGGPEKTPIQALGMTLPMVLGHEIVGRVKAVGPDAAGVAVGDLRLVYPWIGCGTCEACLAEEDNRCLRSAALGVRRPGGFGSEVLVPHPRYLIDISGLDPALAATYACSGLTVYSAIQKVLPRPPDQPIVLVGAGGLGLSAIQVLKALGHRSIISVDVNAERRQAALDAGASAAVDGSGDDVGARLKAAADDQPITAVIDLVNSSETARFTVSSLGRGGKLVLVGMFGGVMNAPLMMFPALDLTVQGNYVGSLKNLKALIALAKSGALKPIPLATVPPSQASETLERLRDGKVVGRVVLAS